MVKANGLGTSLPGIATTAVLIFPNDEYTSDCSWFCTGDDGSEYAVKDMQIDARIPHAEWFCTRLGERVGLVSPPSNVVIVQSEECFGSRWETVPKLDWWLAAKAGEIDFNELSSGLSRILAFDLFIHNDDQGFARPAGSPINETGNESWRFKNRA